MRRYITTISKTEKGHPWVRLDEWEHGSLLLYEEAQVDFVRKDDLIRQLMECADCGDDTEGCALGYPDCQKGRIFEEARAELKIPAAEDGRQ